MKYIYKLTDQDMQTHKGFQWEMNKWYETSGKGGLCSAGWLHGYEDPLLALLHNPAHANIKNPRLFKMEYEGRKKRDGQMKCGVSRARLVEELELPVVSRTQRIAYGILCAKKVNSDINWNKWADDWLSGKDRTAEAADAAGAAAEAAMVSAGAAAEAADAAWAARAARSAYYSVEAACVAVRTNPKLNLKKIAKEAMKVKKGGKLCY